MVQAVPDAPRFAAARRSAGFARGPHRGRRFRPQLPQSTRNLAVVRARALAPSVIFASAFGRVKLSRAVPTPPGMSNAHGHVPATAPSLAQRPTTRRRRCRCVRSRPTTEWARRDRTQNQHDNRRGGGDVKQVAGRLTAAAHVHLEQRGSEQTPHLAWVCPVPGSAKRRTFAVSRNRARCVQTVRL